MKLHGKTAIGRLDRPVVGRALDLQKFVIVSISHLLPLKHLPLRIAPERQKLHKSHTKASRLGVVVDLGKLGIDNAVIRRRSFGFGRRG